MNADTLVWDLDPNLASDVRLCHSATAALDFSENGVTGGEYLSLTPGASSDDPATQLIRQPPGKPHLLLAVSKPLIWPARSSLPWP